MNRGSGILEPILILAVIFFIMISAPKASLEQQHLRYGSFTNKETKSQSISLDSGNAPYAYQPYEEYVSISNWSSSPVDISGWQLKNIKNHIATLPNLVLGPNERAIIITGRSGVQTPYQIPNIFKENDCTGYLEALPDYTFSPSLQYSCPNPANELGVERLDRECRDFVNRISTCETPVFDAKDRDKETCTTCVKGTRLSSACATYVREHFSYKGCLSYHSDDKDFNSSRTWRVFLGRGWEMWSEKYETIELLDRFDNLISNVNY